MPTATGPQCCQSCGCDLFFCLRGCNLLPMTDGISNLYGASIEKFVDGEGWVNVGQLVGDSPSTGCYSFRLHGVSPGDQLRASYTINGAPYDVYYLDGVHEFEFIECGQGVTATAEVREEYECDCLVCEDKPLAVPRCFRVTGPQGLDLLFYTDGTPTDNCWEFTVVRPVINSCYTPGECFEFSSLLMVPVRFTLGGWCVGGLALGLEMPVYPRPDPVPFCPDYPEWDQPEGCVLNQFPLCGANGNVQNRCPDYYVPIGNLPCSMFPYTDGPVTNCPPNGPDEPPPQRIGYCIASVGATVNIDCDSANPWVLSFTIEFDEPVDCVCRGGDAFNSPVNAVSMRSPFQDVFGDSATFSVSPCGEGYGY